MMTDFFDRISSLATQPAIEPAMQGMAKRASELIDEAMLIQQIAAPTSGETARAEFLYKQLQAIGLSDVWKDDLQVVYGRWPGGDSSAPAIMVSAHLDTVFPLGTNLALRHESGRIFGPGLGDNSVGVAALLTLARTLKAHQLQLPADVWLVGTVGEEGMGNLRGMRRAVERLRDKLGIVVVLEGIALGHIFHAGLSVRRLNISASGPGGHSWLNQGSPSAIHCLLQLGALISKLEAPSGAQTSLNIGLLEGGTSINTIAPYASLSLDLRSEDAGALAALENLVRETVSAYDAPAGIAIEVEVIGERPAGTLPRKHPLVQACGHVLGLLKVHGVQYAAASTDANLPLAEGLPAVTIGITSGGNAHCADEYIDTGPVVTGLQQMLLLTLAAAHHSREWADWDAGEM